MENEFAKVWKSFDAWIIVWNVDSDAIHTCANSVWNIFVSIQCDETILKLVNSLLKSCSRVNVPKAVFILLFLSRSENC
jgi:hypothetical protein